MKRKIIFIFSLFFTLTICWMINVKASSGDLYLNNLHFDVQINSDGSMDVVETWDIDIEETNTLYKTFKTDSTKYSSIDNVEVYQLINGSKQLLRKTDTWAYHADKGSYYGTKNEDEEFEIGWGVGLDYSSDTRIYQISYRVNDAICKYNDYAELYWQFVGNKFEIDAKEISGTILLPTEVEIKDDIKVWGHTEGLNGTIYATDLNKIEFEINRFKSGRFVEIRTLFPTYIIETSNRIKNTNVIEKAIAEETEWANAANKRREQKELEKKLIAMGILLVNAVLIIVFFVVACKLIKKFKNMERKYNPTSKLDYYRDLPSDDITPSVAYYLVSNNFSKFNSIEFGKIFSATMLNLALKGYIEFYQDEKKKVKFKINNKDAESLKQDEKYVYNYINDLTKGEEKTIKEFEKLIGKYPTKIEKLIENVYKVADTTNVNLENIDSKNKKFRKKYSDYVVIYIILAFFINLFTMCSFLPASIMFIVDAIICMKISKKANVLTQKGVDQVEQLKGLKKFMEDFSMLDKREVPELVLWEKYLVYATVFGVADKVIKQLKIVYPDFEKNMDLQTYSCMNLMMHSDFNSSFTRAINSAISSTYSSGSGSGGGFSGGGGFGRRRRWRWTVDSHLSLV